MGVGRGTCINETFKKFHSTLPIGSVPFSKPSIGFAFLREKMGVLSPLLSLHNRAEDFEATDS